MDKQVAREQVTDLVKAVARAQDAATYHGNSSDPNVERTIESAVESILELVPSVPVLLAPTPDPSADVGEYDDEFPNEHSHLPKALEQGGVGLHVAEDEGRHYYLELKPTDEGVIIDVFDRYGDECLATFGRTWEELLALVFANDPLA